MVKMTYKCAKVGSLGSLSRAESILFSEGFSFGYDSPDLVTYKGTRIPESALPKNIFMGNDTPALEKATTDFMVGYGKLNHQLSADGLERVDLPKEVKALDLGESAALIPTKYGGLAVVPAGTTNAYNNIVEDEIVLNRRVIYGTKEHKESLNLYRTALKFVEEHAPEWVKKVIKPFYKDKISIMESESDSRTDLRETSAHELVHSKQMKTGILEGLFNKYGGITNYVRDLVEKSCIRYTSRIFGKRTTERGTGYGQLEDEASVSERRKNRGPQNILQMAELHGPEVAVDELENTYSLAA